MSPDSPTRRLVTACALSCRRMTTICATTKATVEFHSIDLTRADVVSLGFGPRSDMVE
jgi:hypothetical protein